MKKVFIFLTLFLIFNANVKADNAEGWINNVDQFNNVVFLHCNANNCSGDITMNSLSFPLSSTLDFTYKQTVNYYINQNYYGEMLLDFHRYKSNYLYSHTMYICSSSSSWTLGDGQVDLHTGSWSETTGMKGGLSYHNVLIQTMNSKPYAPSQKNFGVCYAITSLFSSYRDGQNVGTVLHGSRVSNASLAFIGEQWTELGIYDGFFKDEINSIIDDSGLATASSINEVKSSINEVKSNINELNETQKETNNKLDETNQSIKDTNDTIKDSDTSGANDTASGFFDDFTDDDYGLSDIITMPLQVINSLTSSSCVELELTVPFVNKKLKLPCMSSIYSQYFSDAYTLYQTATTGFVAYWVIVKIYALIKSFKNPDDDKIEVMDL